ncbi:MAG: hypothetical protein ACXWH0_12385, partial [Acidimicrobiia bacterium]
HQTSVTTGRTMQEITEGKSRVWHSNRSESSESADQSKPDTAIKGSGRKLAGSSYERLMASRTR